jgi:glycosyltransferase involved in cell wall biosynthesis
MRIAVCAPQVPFERGGTEILAETLVRELRTRGHEVEDVKIPFKWYPRARALREALLWRLVDLEEAQERPVDLVIATKFPSYAIRHPNKVVWLVHQFRQAYELDRADFGQFGENPFDRATVRAIHRHDRKTLGEAKRLFAISRNVADRLQRSTGLSAEVLPPPPQQLAYRSPEGAGEFILSVGRLDRAKRVDMLLEAAALDGSLSVVVAGEGPDRERLERLSAERGLDGRVTFAGRVDDDELVDLYARSHAVFYAPFDEDFGLVPYEAFLSERPVVTTHDAGGPLEVVIDEENGIVCEPVPSAVAAALSWLAANPDQARARGRAGKRRAEEVTWDSVIDRLVGT